MNDSLFEVTVTRRADITDDLFVIDLASKAQPLPAWSPGAHIDLEAGPVGLRQYSLAGDSADPSIWRLGIRREAQGRGGSHWLHENAITGAVLKVGVPRNHFAYETASTPVVFIAGGIGITPILPMIERAKSTGRPWELHYVGASLENMPFRETFVADEEKTNLYPRDVSSRPDIKGIIDALEPGSSVYSCGPESLMLEVERLGGAREDVTTKVERFSPRDVGDERGLDTFEVEFEYSGKTVQIQQGETILDAARGAGIEVISSCQEGTCGSCETPVLSGTPVHLDSVLSEKERQESKCMMICVSRSLTPRLVLDM